MYYQQTHRSNKTHKIISPLNWAALSRCSTQELIHIIQNIIEHAKENARQAWILSQDMSKAYDSINIGMLHKALQRIQIPSQLIAIILSLFENRENSVITLYGNTAEYKVKDGIDQGDTISSLLWQIYYDSLLTRVSRLHTGYTITSKTCSDIRVGWTLQHSNIATSAYMDDTTWIANNKSGL